MLAVLMMPMVKGWKCLFRLMYESAIAMFCGRNSAAASSCMATERSVMMKSVNIHAMIWFFVIAEAKIPIDRKSAETRNRPSEPVRMGPQCGVEAYSRTAESAAMGISMRSEVKMSVPSHFPMMTCVSAMGAVMSVSIVPVESSSEMSLMVSAGASDMSSQMTHEKVNRMSAGPPMYSVNLKKMSVRPRENSASMMYAMGE